MPRGIGSLRTGLARAGRHVLEQAAETLRAFLFMMLGLAARLLPRAWAFSLADIVRRFLAVSPLGAHARQMFRATFPSEGARASALAAEWLGRPFRDHVNAVRIATGREDVREWKVEMRNAPALLGDPDQSFIIATGHFSREAMTALYVRWLFQHRLATVVAPLTQAQNARGVRVREQMRAIRKGIEVLRMGDVDIADVSGKAFLVRLLHHLREPGGVVIIASDAAWGGDRPNYSRPFAAFASQPFAIGTARLARMSQRPIVSCVPYLDGDKRVVMEWSPVIQPPARDDAEADVRITNEILDWIERRIGERPGQYVLSFGRARRWNPVARCWADADHIEASNDSAPLTPAHLVKTAKSAS